MRNLTMIALALGIAAAFSNEAAAQTYPWCANYGVDSSKNCGFVSRAQCMETIHGMGGHCEENPLYSVQAPASAAHAPVEKKPRR